MRKNWPWQQWEMRDGNGLELGDGRRWRCWLVEAERRMKTNGRRSEGQTTYCPRQSMIRGRGSCSNEHQQQAAKQVLLPSPSSSFFPSHTHIHTNTHNTSKGQTQDNIADSTTPTPTHHL
jgi:hypothetical protein